MDLLLARKTEMLSSSKPGVCVCVLNSFRLPMLIDRRP